jgi:hypothetical protein
METAIFILSVALVFLLLSIVFFFVFPDMTSGGQIFDDFIIEHVSSTGGNKSAELMLFFILSVACILLTKRWQRGTLF